MIRQEKFDPDRTFGFAQFCVVGNIFPNSGKEVLRSAGSGRRRTRSRCERPWRRTGHSRASTSGFPRARASERRATWTARDRRGRSEEHTSELQSPCNLVCRLLLEKKKHNE